jgi:predicted  nucleic acid-binding Zn-ribbon protein
MHPDIKLLIELQSVDVRLSALRARLADLPKQLAAVDQRVAAAKQQVSASKEALTQSLKDRKTFEMDVESWKEKARRYRNQGSEVKTNEAYKALQHEIEHAEGEAAGAEDRLLERMVAGEQFDRNVKGAELAVVAVEREAQGERAKIQAEQAVLQKELEAREAERKQAVAAIPEGLFENYERIAQHRHGVAIAEVRDEACTLCGVRVRPHVFQKLRREGFQEIFQCETCTRILYYIEPPAPAAVPDGANAGASEPSAHDS